MRLWHGILAIGILVLIFFIYEDTRDKIAYYRRSVIEAKAVQNVWEDLIAHMEACKCHQEDIP